MKIEIRFPLASEIKDLVELCKLHAAYEEAEFEENHQELRLTRDLLSSKPKLYCLLAIRSDEIVGYVTFMKQYSTWEAKEYIYMDCLYVKEYARGEGVGELLVNEVKSHGQSLGCSLIQWQTPSFNKRAMKFYDRIGAY
jgi:ribosomal protein S18 acetylase RimI-like enzyme